MRSTIDGGGRVVIPKSIRDLLGLGPGAVVEVEERDGHVEIAPADASIELVDVGGVLVARSADEFFRFPAVDPASLRRAVETMALPPRA